MNLVRNGKPTSSTRVIAAFLALMTLSASTFSCVSGGFRLSRILARWTNSQMIVLRILIYVLLYPVFLIAELLDVILLNTIDFWSGTVSARNDVIEKDGERVEIAHTRTPLRKSVITRIAKDGMRTVTELRETPRDSIEVYIDGIKKAELQGVSESLSTLALYDSTGTAPVTSRTFAPGEFASIDSMPVAEGAQQVYARLGILPQYGASLACR